MESAKMEKIVANVLSMENGQVTGYLTDYGKQQCYYFSMKYVTTSDGLFCLEGLKLTRQEELSIKKAMYMEIAKKARHPIFA